MLQPHTSRMTQNYLHGEGINVIPWPASSPIMNPIEELWDQLKRSVYQTMDDSSTLDDLWRIALEESQSGESYMLQGQWWLYTLPV